MNSLNKKILLSGIQPSGDLHVGNYFGAMKQFVDLQDEYESYISIVNYHALTTVQNKEELSKNTFQAVVDHLAAGLDPQKTTLFIQSDIPELQELSWIFQTLITTPFLERAHAYKDKTSKGVEPSVGLFTYPVLMAADILSMDADVVPVGEDQRQHIEMTREVARKFNLIFGKLFKEPEEKIIDDVAVVPGVDGQKMSKSYKNTIPLFGSDKEIKKQVMSIVTDSKDVDEPKNPEKDNVFALHKLFSKDILPELKDRYESGGMGHKESKELLAQNIINTVSPMREKREKLMNDKSYIFGVLEDGAKKARERAIEKIEKAKDMTGLNYRS